MPMAGLWHADLVLSKATDIAGPQSLLFAGAIWSCAYVRAIDFAGERGVRVVAGLGGWRTAIPAKQYGAGVIATATVVSDAALACGEPPPVIDVSVPQTVGSAFLRASGLGSTTLQAVLGSVWWADTSGVVQSRPRSGSVLSAFQAMAVDGWSGRYSIGTDAPNDWTPGVAFAGPTTSGTVSRVTHRITPTSLRTEVLVS